MTKKLPSIGHIGNDITIVKSINPSLMGIKGRVIDETKNTLVVESRDKIRKLLKNQVTIRIR